MTTDARGKGAPVGASAPLVRFVRLAPDALAPMRADRAALGTLPASALRYCEPVCAASAFGYYVFPPIDFHVLYDGTDFVWSHDDGANWHPVRSEHLPGLPERFDAIAPDDVKGFAPPFLTATLQPGVLQVWSGWLVRTRPGWSVLIRPPANLARSQHYELFEGIIDSDRWFYSVFTNLRVTTTNRPIAFRRTHPYLQVQPIERATFEEQNLREMQIEDDLAGLRTEDWDAYRRVFVERGKDPMMRPGRYATATRKRGRIEDG